MVGDKVAKNKGVFFVIFATYPYQNTTRLYSIKIIDRSIGVNRAVIFI